MSGPYAKSLIQLEGPVVPWQSQPMAPPASGGRYEVGLSIGSNRGMFGAYARARISSDGYSRSDIIQVTPDFMQPVGTPGGNIAMRLNPSRFSTLVLQNIYSAERTSGVRLDLGGNVNYSVEYRGLLAAGPGPYASRLRGEAPEGPLVGGQTAEVTGAGGTVVTEIKNPTGVEPFMWTLFGRCLVAEGGCQVGDVMAFGSEKQAGSGHGLATSYSPLTKTFSVSIYSAAPFMIGKDGAFFGPNLANWSLFFRFAGMQGRGGYSGRVPTRALRQSPPLSLWTSRLIPLVAAPVPVSIAMQEDFTPVLANAFLVCKAPEAGYSVGDWMPSQEGNSNSLIGGLSATFDGRQVTLAPYNGGLYGHRLSDGAGFTLTPANWSWFFVFVG